MIRFGKTKNIVGKKCLFLSIQFKINNYEKYNLHLSYTFIGINSSAQEKKELDELNSYLKKSNNKTYVNNGILFYKTSSEYSLEYNGSKNKESPIIEFNLKKLIVYRKKYNENNQSFELSLTFRDKEEIQKTGFKIITISFNNISSDELDQVIKTLKSYYIKK